MKSECNACIFDMDDTLVNTTELWRNAEMRMLNFCGVPWTPACDRLFRGLGPTAIVSVAKTHLGIEACDAQMLCILREALFEEFHAQPLQPIDGVMNLVRRCADLVPIAVASGSPLELIEYTMQQINLLDQFEIVLSSESVARGKPFPDIFLETAKHMQLSPQSCLIFEDSVPGVQAAKLAGARCILRPSLPLEEPLEGIERIVASWDQLDSAYLGDILTG